MFDEKPEYKSTYNEGMFQIQRLNNLYLEAQSFCNKGDFKNYNIRLDHIYSELCADVNKSKKANEYKIDYLRISTDYLKNKDNKAKAYLCLKEKENLLRNIQDDVGKGTRRQKDFESGMT